MRTIYRQVLRDLELRIEQLQATHAVVQAIAGDDPKPREVLKLAKRAKGKGRKGRAAKKPRANGHVTGTDAIVLDVITAGADTLAAIADQAKVKTYAATQSIHRLEGLGKVKREGATRNLRYVPAKR